jgi:hypothetical protein
MLSVKGMQMISLETEIMRNARSNWYKQLMASGFPREVELMLSGASFAMLSAEDGRLNTTPDGRAENHKRDLELKRILSEHGLGFTVNTGIWDDTDLKVSLPEKSLFIANISERLAQEICRAFKQQAYIYGEGGYFWLKSGDGSVMMEGKIADYFQELPGNAASDYTVTDGRKWNLAPPAEHITLRGNYVSRIKQP